MHRAARAPHAAGRKVLTRCVVRVGVWGCSCSSAWRVTSEIDVPAASAWATARVWRAAAAALSTATCLVATRLGGNFGRRQGQRRWQGGQWQRWQGAWTR